MKQFGILVAVCLSVATGAIAAPKKPVKKAVTAPKLTAAQVMEKSIAAAGGKAAYQRLKNVLMDGTVEIQPLGMQGTMELRVKAPNRSVSSYRFGQGGESRRGFDGTNAWSASAAGVKEITGAEKAFLSHASRLHAALEWRKFYSKVEMVGLRKVDNRSCYVLRQYYPGHAPFVCYYDAKTFLTLRMDTVTDMAGLKNMPVITYFTDYRKVDGLKMPFVLMEKAGKGLYTVTRINNLLTNVAMSDELFVKPGSPTASAR